MNKQLSATPPVSPTVALQTPARSRRNEAIYIAFCVVGAALPLSQLLPWLAQNGLNLPLLTNELFANRVSSAFGWDVLISAFVLLDTLILNQDGLRRSQRLFIAVGTCLIGVSFGLPLYFLFRERQRPVTR